jgi:hypothetical protein
MQRLTLMLAAVMSLCSLSDRGYADDYWNYAYKTFDVTTDQNGGRAIVIAHNVARFDAALTKLMRLTEANIPIHIYELRPNESQGLIGQGSCAAYQFTGYEANIVACRESRMDGYWGPLFGYTGSLLVSGRARRCPYWYEVGVPLLFANTDFGAEWVSTGFADDGWIRTLTHADLIPTRTLLRMQVGDPQLRREPRYFGLFQAESWFLAYQTLVRGIHKDELGQYLSLIQDGKTEEEAFSGSFKISYEDLDTELKKALVGRDSFYKVNVPREPVDSGSARRLPDAVMKARLAYLHLLWGHRAVALRLGTDVLKEDKGNGLALAVIAQSDVGNQDYGDALAALNKLDDLPVVGAEERSLAGYALVELANAVASKKASLGSETDVLSSRAKDEFERSISLKADYLPPWAGLAYVYESRRDATGAQSFVARAHALMEKHSENGALAHALATMSSANDMIADAVFFGDFWRDNAPTQQDRERAIAFLARLHSTK